MPHVSTVSRRMYPNCDACQIYVTYIRCAHNVYCTDESELAKAFTCEFNHTSIEAEQILNQLDASVTQRSPL